MEVIKNVKNISSFKTSVLTIGSYDGIHLGHKKILDEVKLIKGQSVSQSQNSLWKGAVLHGIDSDKPRPAKFYGFNDEDKAPYKWTSISKNAKYTVNWINTTFNYKKMYRVKVNLLEAQGKIGPHVDSKKSILGVSDLTSPENVTYITIALRWPKEVHYNVGKYKVPISDGDAYLINFSNLHEVYNYSNSDRYSMIIMADMSDCENWKLLVEKSYKKYGNEYLSNKSKLSFLVKSRLINRPLYLLNRLKNKF